MLMRDKYKNKNKNTSLQEYQALLKSRIIIKVYGLMV